MESKTRTDALVEITYLFVVPVLLVYLDIIPIEGRALVLLLVSLIIFRIMRHERWTKSMMGLSGLFRLKAVFVYAAITMVGVVAIRLYGEALGFEPLNLFDLSQSLQLLLFFIPLSVLQEVAYRGFLSERLKSVSQRRTVRVFISTILFTFLHIIYPFPQIMLPLAAVGGVVFALVYEAYPDLLLVSFMHMAFNFTAVLFGFFTFL